MFKKLKMDKKLKDKSFKNYNASKTKEDLEKLNYDGKEKINYSKPKPKKNPPTDKQMFGTKPLKEEKKVKKNKTKSVSLKGKVKYSKTNFKY